MMIDAGGNRKNSMIKVCVTKDLFGILVVMSMNVINDVMLVII